MEDINTKCLHLITREDAYEIGMLKFFTGTPCKHGHERERCVKTGICIRCREISSAKSRLNNPKPKVADLTEEQREDLRAKGRERYQKYKERIIKRNNRHYHENKEEILKKQSEKWLEIKHDPINIAKRKEYYSKNRDIILERVKEWYQNNRERSNEYHREYRKKKWKDSPEIMIVSRCRDFVRRFSERFEGKTNFVKSNKLGYSPLELKEHIESLFLEGMSWEDTSSFHIDHIYPVSRYLSEGVTDPAVINALTNLAPMYPEDNLSKGAKTLEEWLSSKGEGSREWNLYSSLLDM